MEHKPPSFSIFHLRLSVCCLVTKSRPTLTTLCTVARQAPLPMGFPRTEFPRENTGVGCHFLLQGIFQGLTQGLNPHLLHCRQTGSRWATWEVLQRISGALLKAHLRVHRKAVARKSSSGNRVWNWSKFGGPVLEETDSWSLRFPPPSIESTWGRGAPKPVHLDKLQEILTWQVRDRSPYHHPQLTSRKAIKVRAAPLDQLDHLWYS